MCARLDYPLDRLEDVKLAVDEACHSCSSDTDADGTLSVAMAPGEDGQLNVAVSAVTRHGKTPKQSSFAWTVLQRTRRRRVRQRRRGSSGASL